MGLLRGPCRVQWALINQTPRAPPDTPPLLTALQLLPTLALVHWNRPIYFCTLPNSGL